MPMLSKVKQSLHKHFLPPDIHKSLNAPEGVVRPRVWLDVVRGEESNDAKRIEIGASSPVPGTRCPPPPPPPPLSRFS